MRKNINVYNFGYISEQLLLGKSVTIVLCHVRLAILQSDVAVRSRIYLVELSTQVQSRPPYLYDPPVHAELYSTHFVLADQTVAAAFIESVTGLADTGRSFA
jgi:hypothetical protein